MTKAETRRSRIWYAVAMVAVIIIGLAARYSPLLPPWLAKAAGDALWALCVFLVIGWCRPAAAAHSVALAALAFAFAIEISQLYHAPWIDTLRHFRLAAMILGSHFGWMDFLYYAVGVAIGWMVEGVNRDTIGGKRCEPPS